MPRIQYINKRKLFIYSTHTMFCLIYLHPVNRFPAVFHSTSPPADRCSLADLSWLFGAIVCLMCATASTFPRASATMKYWSLIHSGENINGSANLKEKRRLGEGSSLSPMGHVKVNSLLGLKVQPQQHHQIKETHTLTWPLRSMCGIYISLPKCLLFFSSTQLL